MHVEYHKNYSGWLGRDMEFKVYGHHGKPVIAFPTSYGRFWQWGDLGMIDALSGLINEGRIQVFTIDGMDTEHVFSKYWDKMALIKRYDAYMGYAREELLPHALDISRRSNSAPEMKAIATGASLGAFHAANFMFHNPWQVDGLVAMSGVYSTQDMMGDYKPDEIAAYSPLNYMQGTFVDSRWLAYQASKIVLVCGQGAWEEPMLTETKLMGDLLRRRDIPVWEDLWGHDVDHDWPWWKVQLPYYLDKIV
jgi:esterase/lipase superfamily enzyme